jgi:hypothetical protein
VLPVHPLDEKQTEWNCSQCPYTLTAAVVKQVTDELKEEFETIPSNNPEVEK